MHSAVGANAIKQDIIIIIEQICIVEFFCDVDLILLSHHFPPLVLQAAVLLEQERQQEMAKIGGPRIMPPIGPGRGAFHAVISFLYLFFFYK